MLDRVKEMEQKMNKYGIYCITIDDYNNKVYRKYYLNSNSELGVSIRSFKKNDPKRLDWEHSKLISYSSQDKKFVKILSKDINSRELKKLFELQ
jgi:hypothetical protein